MAAGKESGAMRHGIPVTVVALAVAGLSAGAEPRWGELVVKIMNAASGAPMPGKICLLHAEDGAPARLLSQSSKTQVVRPGGAYTLSGEVYLTVLPGEYRVMAGRGIEYGVAEAVVTVTPTGKAEVTLALRREVDTSGYIAGDMHLHTVFSDGDPSPVERVIALAGEGVEFGVASDHGYVTDYGPAVERLKARAHVVCVRGDEITTWGDDGIGHFNAYPRPPEAAAISSTLTTGPEMFAAIRAAPGEPLIQVNHPRWKDGSYFTKAEVDPETGIGGPKFAEDFDAIEIMNEYNLWGWITDPRVKTDWFNLLNRGLRFAAVACSDSHGVWDSSGGMPRTYIASSTDDPARIDPDEIMRAIRDARCTSASGVFLALEVNGEAMGGETVARGGLADVRARLQAPHWIPVEEMEIVVNGRTAETFVIGKPGEGEPVDAARTVRLKLKNDSWIVALARGPEVNHPLYGHRILPQAATNPVWVDADGDGRVRIGDQK